MGRTNVTDESVVETVKTDVVETAPKKEKAASFTVTATVKTRTRDGDRVTHKYKGTGSSLSEALDSVVGSEEDLVDEFGRPFPQNINILTNIVISKGDYRFERACAPQTTKAILQDKNVALAMRLFGIEK